MSPSKSGDVRFLLVYLILLLSVFARGQSYQDMPLTLKKTIEKHDIHRIRFSDVNGNGFDEYLVEVPQQGVRSALRLYSHDLQRLYFQRNLEFRLVQFMTLEWEKPGIREIMLIEQKKREVNLLLVDSHSAKDTLAFLTLFRTESEFPDIKVKDPVTLDINGDSWPEVIIPFSSGLSAVIRAVWAVDIRNREILWKYDVAPNIAAVDLVNTMQTEEPLLLIGNIAPNNGHRTSHMDDAHTYALILNALKGKLVFLKETGEWPSATSLKHMKQGESVLLYLTTIEQNVHSKNQSRFQILSSPDFSVEKKLSNIKPDEWFLSEDINNDGAGEFLRSGHNSQIIIYNSQLEHLETIELSGKKCRLEKIADIDDDGFVELLVVEDKNTLTILNSEGEILSSQQGITGNPFVVKKGDDASLAIGMFDPQKNIYQEWVLSPGTVLSETGRDFLWIGFIAGLLSVLIIYLGFVAYRRIRPNLTSGLQAIDNLNVPVLVVGLNGEIHLANREMEKLLDMDALTIRQGGLKTVLKRLNLKFSIEDWKNKQQCRPLEFEVESRIRNRQNKYQIRIRSISKNNRIVAMILVAEDISRMAHYHQSLAWTAMAQRLVHEIKNPLTTVKLTLQRMKMEYEEVEPEKKRHYDSYLDSVLEEVLRLRNVADNFLKFFRADHPDYKNVNICDLISSLVGKYRSVLPEQVELCFNNHTEDCVIEADPNQIEILLSNIIDNSIHAIEKKGSIEIRLNVLDKFESEGIRSYAVIDIEDSGRGLDQPELEKVFEPYISGDSDGTGLGLSIVRKIAESHQGTVRITSKKNIGTLVTIELPVKHRKTEK